MNNIFRQIYFVAALAAVILGDGPKPPKWVDFNEDRGECTTAVISGRATQSGRPMLWKNRDVTQPNQAVRFFDDGPYRYLALCDAGDSTKAFAGLNSAGFAIIDANNLNTPDTVQGPDNGGRIMKLALQRCRAVDDFQAILDSTQVVGHRQPMIYGVIDTSGGAAVIETFCHSYIRYDASDSADAPYGILVRSNFSYAGSSSGRIGVHRHDRARTLLQGAAQGDSLTPFFVCRTVARDLQTSSLNPYPLPYQSRYGNLPTGWITTYGAISRRQSVAGCVVEGVLAGEDPLLATMWTFPMAVQYGVALPFWVASGTTPPEVSSDSLAPLCNEGIRLRTMAQLDTGFHDTLNSTILEDGHGGGLHVTTYLLENRIFAQTDSALQQWRVANSPDSADMAPLTARLTHMVYDTLRAWPRPGQLWSPPCAVRDLTLYQVPGTGLRLRWSMVAEDALGWPITPAYYKILRYHSCGSTPDSIGSTSETTFVIPQFADSTAGFFEVRAVR